MLNGDKDVKEERIMRIKNKKLYNVSEAQKDREKNTKQHVEIKMMIWEIR